MSEKQEVVYAPLSSERLERLGELTAVLQIATGESRSCTVMQGYGHKIIESLLVAFDDNESVYKIFKEAVKMHKRSKKARSMPPEILEALAKAFGESLDELKDYIEQEEKAKNN